MTSISWCLKQKKGIKMVKPNVNLSDQYMKEAEDTLHVMLTIKGKWKTITAYYACYNALYSILMKAGIESEIHDCSLSLMRLIDGFDEEDVEFLISLKKDRIDTQYYLKLIEFEDDNRIKSFVAKCKRILFANLDYLHKKIKEVQHEEN